MNKRTLSLGLAMGLLAIAGCDNDRSARNATASNDGNDAVKQFFTLAKAAGLDLTLEGPGPYTVFVPSDAAFDKLPAGTADGWSKPENRATLTRTLTYHILPGTVLAEDIGKAIDNGKGKAQLATVGGTALTATKDGDRIVLTDGAGGKRANGVVHETDAVLMPGEAS
jgi:uncharacterized surface protein with fasciclin (FAS1) repeats